MFYCSSSCSEQSDRGAILLKYALPGGLQNRALVPLAFAEGTTLERNQLTVVIQNHTSNGGK
jgi:hypothetical protein